MIHIEHTWPRSRWIRQSVWDRRADTETYPMDPKARQGFLMTNDILTDAQIDALTGAQRRELIRRLERPVAQLKPHYVERASQAHLGLMTGGALFMIPWIVYLHGPCRRTTPCTTGR